MSWSLPFRVTIASSDWPSNWPNPLAATNTIHVAQGGTIGVSTFVLPVVPAAPSPTRPTFQVAHDLSANTVTYRSSGRTEQAVPGGTMVQEDAWRIDLTKAPPYRQVIDYASVRTLRRPGQPELRVTWRVRTDSAGPRATVEWLERPIP